MAKNPKISEGAPPEGPMGADEVMEDTAPQTKAVPAAPAAPAAAEPAEPLITISEFCARKSADNFQPHRLTPFYNEEIAKGREKDTAANYERRLKEMMARPAR